MKTKISSLIINLPLIHGFINTPEKVTIPDINGPKETKNEEEEAILEAQKMPIDLALQLIQNITQKTIISAPDLPKNEITINIQNLPTGTDLQLLLENALSANGIALIEIDKQTLKAISTKTVVHQAPHLIQTPLNKEDPSERIYAKLYQFQHIEAEKFADLTKGLLTPEISHQITFKEANSIFTIDRLTNLKQIENLKKIIDLPKKTIIQSEIIQIKFGDANKIAALLNNILAEQNTNKQTPPNIEPTNIQKQDAKEIYFSPKATITTDERTNALIICGTRTDIQSLKQIIHQIDKPLNQIRIDVIIVEAALSKTCQTGLQALNIAYNGAEADGAKAKINHPAIDVQGKGSLKGLIMDPKTFSTAMLLKTSQSNGKIKIISAPTIVATHNKQATIMTAESIPIIKNGITSTDSANTDATILKTTVEYKDVGTKLTVTPQIGDKETIQLEIQQEIERLGEKTNIGGTDMYRTIKRNAQSFLSVPNGHTVILAGLQDQQDSHTKSDISILQKIPIIGKIFTPKEHQTIRTEIIIFITPTIIKQENSYISETQDHNKIKPQKRKENKRR